MKNYLLLLAIVLLVVLGCNSPTKTDNQQSKNATIEIDTVFASPRDYLEYIINNVELSVNERLHIYKDLIWILLDDDLDKAIYYGNLGLDLLKVENDDDFKASLLCYIAQVYMEKGDFDSAKICLDEALLCAKNVENEYLEISIYFIYGKLCSLMGDELASIEYYEMALQLAEKQENNDDIAYALYCISFGHFNDENYEQAEKYLLKALEIYQTKVDQPATHTISHIYSSLSKIYHESGRNKEAFENAQKGLEFAQLANINFYEIEALLTLSGGYSAYKQDYNKALELANQALSLAEEGEYVYLRMNCYIIIGNTYYLSKNFSKSKIYLLKALDLIHPDDLIGRKKALRFLIKSMIKLKDMDEVLDAFIAFDSISTALYQQNTQHALSELEIRFETEKKKLEIEKQRNIIKSKNMQRNMFAGGVAISVVILFLLWYMLRLRTRRNHALAEMNATKDKFFSIISHDLKNPAVAQRDAIQQLVKSANLWSNEELTSYCSNLLKSADEEVELLYTLLSWTQIQTEGISYTPVTFDLPVHLRTDISLIRIGGEVSLYNLRS